MTARAERILPRLGAALLAAALCGTAPGALAQPASSAQSAAGTSQIDTARLRALPAFIEDMVTRQIDESEVAGAIVTTVHDGRIVSNAGFGYQDIANDIAVDPGKTLFRPGSVSKLFTWTALMQLVEQGKVDLDADVNTYLDYEIPENGFGPIRVRDLMSHSPGMSDVGGIILRDADKVIPYADFLKARVPRRMWAPGVEPAYSNYATTVAGYIVERVSGMPFVDYVEQNVFAPLKMNDTTFREDFDEEPTNSKLAEGYAMEDGEMVAQEREYAGNVLPAGSASSTGADMARFMMAMLNEGELDGARILKPETVRMMHGDLLALSPNLPGMAYGFLVYQKDGPRIIGHGGNTADFHSDLAIAPGPDFGVFISMTGGPKSYGARTELRRAITGYMFPADPAERWSGAAESAPMGRYRSNRRDYGLAANPDYDVMITRSGPDSVELVRDDETTVWERIGEHRYEQVTDVPEGGPYDQLEFYDTERGARLAFASQPYTAYHFISPE